MAGNLAGVKPVVNKLTPYIPGKSIEEVARELGVKEIIKLASNENPLGPSRLAMEAIQDELANISQYPDNTNRVLREELARRVGLDSAAIALANGEDNIITVVAQTFLEPGERAIIPAMSFPPYRTMSLVSGAEVVEIPLQDFRQDLLATAKAVNERTKLVFICNPNNPTGTGVSEKELTAFLNDLPRHVFVALDEAYCEYVEDPAIPNGVDYLKQGYNVLVMRTFSKFYGLAGLRIGYIMADPVYIEAMLKIKEPFALNRLGDRAALAVLADEEYQAQTRAINRQGKAFLYRELKRLGLQYVPTEANFILLDTGRPTREVHDQLLLRGVIVRPTFSWGLATHIRVTIGTQEQNERFIKALEEVL
ncbi:MAG: histidinol-phosphate transaminase [Bacillota bacterium]